MQLLAHFGGTPYESVEEAEVARDFYCQQCETIRILREEFVLKLKQETERCKLAVVNVTAVLEEEISMTKKEQERIEVLLKVLKNEQDRTQPCLPQRLLQKLSDKAEMTTEPPIGMQSSVKAKDGSTGPGKQPWVPSDRSKVCSLHFKQDDYREGLKMRKSKPDAIPSLFPSYPAYMQEPLPKKRKVVKRVLAQGCRQ
ncbi:hypothetical protein HPB50_015425 [Hyalomma asiaticum]|uniref:Uncharacterized protein n=1 Tax=Hyalomma asiaticum TaxID=266040 RepID=A0ACB7SHE2_HYAAI|nr:hypothetical protein HPB50_015425 [Hyalomma asiaticum]